MSDEPQRLRTGSNKDPEKAIQGPINEESVQPVDFVENRDEEATTTADKRRQEDQDQ
jgi:hypothetical protein